MKTWHVIGGAVAALLVAGCGSATDSDEYRSLSTEAATAQHSLEQAEAELEAAATKLERLQTRTDGLQEVVDDYRSNNLVRTETNQERQAALDARADELDARERTLDARADELTQDTAQVQMQDFGASGTFVVGTDMVAGDYFAPGGPDCRWSYLSGTARGASVILSDRGPTPQYLSIEPGDVFKTEGCGPWTQ